MRLLRIFALFVYWYFAVDGIQWLFNYPSDFTVVLAVLLAALSVFGTYYLIKNKKL